MTCISHQILFGGSSQGERDGWGMGHLVMEREKQTEFRIGNMKERYLLADPGLDGDKILKSIWKKETGRTWQDRGKLQTLVKTVTKFRVA